MTQTKTKRRTEAKTRKTHPIAKGSQPASRTAVLVLGTHGGASPVLARLLALLGADLPTGASAIETAGNLTDGAVFPELYRLHDELLAAACSQWDDWGAVDANWMRSPDAVQFKVRMLELLDREFGESGLFVLNDPRACRLVPFWRDVLAAFGARTTCVIAARHPLEVASRLRVCHGLTPAKSYLLWLRNLLDAEVATRGLPRAVVLIDKLSEDYRTAAEKIGSALKLVWPRRSLTADVQLDQLMEASIRWLIHAQRRRHRVESVAFEHDAEIGEWVRRAYAELIVLSVDPACEGALARLDDIRIDYDRSTLLFAAAGRAEALAWERRHATAAAEHRGEMERARRDSLAQHRGEMERARRDFLAQIATRDESLSALQKAMADLDAEKARIEQTLAAERARATRFEAASARERGGRIRLAMHLNAMQTAAFWQLTKPIAALERRFPRVIHAMIAIPKYVLWAISGRLSERLVLRDGVKTITAAGLFDENAYILHNPDVVLGGYIPIIHWLLVGWKDGLDPHPLFRTSWYLQQYPDVAASGANPLVHYLRQGFREGRNPSPLFDTTWYLAHYPDVAQTGLNPLTHYLRIGSPEGRATCPPPQAGLPAGSRFPSDGPRALACGLACEVSAIRASGELDEQYYLNQNPDTAAAGIDPVLHYCEAGWREGRDPSPGFSTNDYLIVNPDVLERGINPFYHYLATGRDAGRPLSLSAVAKHPVDCEGDEDFSTLATDIKAIAFYLPQFHRIPENDAWWGAGFTEWTNTRAATPRFGGHRQPREPHEDIGYYDLSSIEALKRQAALARSHGIYGLCIYYYWFLGRRLLETPSELLLANPDIDLRFCLCWANESWTRRWDGLDAEVLMPQSYGQDDDIAIIADLARYLRDRRYIRVDGKPLVLVYRPSLLPDMAETASRWRAWCAENGIGDLYLAYVQGAGDATPPADYHLDAVVEFPPLSNVREPSGRGLKLPPTPVNAGVDKDRLREYGDYAVRLSLFPRDVPDGDFFRTAMLAWDNTARRSSGATIFTGFTPKLYGQWLSRAIEWTRQRHRRANRFVFINAWNEWAEGTYLEPDTQLGYACLNETSRAIFGLREQEACPLVSVVVPNYNHASYLRQRLESIYDQSYANLDVILLDDCSTDDSRQVLEEYARKYPECTRVVVNSANSGCVFRQWRSGIDLATADFVWIAESDDYCDRNFLKTLVPYLVNDEAVNICYSRTTFVDASGIATSYTSESYLSPISTEKWRAAYVNTAHREVAEALSLRNTIPNVSSVVFRKPITLPLLADEEWLGMQICGDWLFYLHLARGGKVAFDPATGNYFRRHPSSSSAKTYAQEVYYREHERVAFGIATLYDAPEGVLRGNRDIIHRFWQDMASGTAPFEALYNIDAVLAARRYRGPNILISILAFSPGGGEIFPIRLANELKRKGHAITVHSLEYLAQDRRVRDLLRSDIPVVRCSTPGVFLEILDSFGIEVVNTHHHGTQELFMKAIRQSRTDNPIKHVATSHGVYEVLPTDYLDNSLLAIDECVDLWTCVADKNLQPFQQRGLYFPDRFVQIGNGMEPPEVRPADREALGISKDAFVLCIATRAIPDKGWRQAIDAVSVARARSSRDIQLLLVGNGPLYDELMGEQLPGHVHLLGFREDPVNYYACADVGLLPSYYKAESFPLTVVESLFAGRPVIASNVGEIKSMLQQYGETAGALFDLVDNAVPVEVLAEIILSFATDEVRYQAAATMASRLSRRFEIGPVADRYVAAFHKVLGRTAPSVPPSSVL